MEEIKDTKIITGRFLGRYIALGIIIGGISFLLENLVPQYADWEFSGTLIIYQSVLFVISTLLTIVLSVKFGLNNVIFDTKEEARQAAKPIRTILIFVALIILCCNFFYCVGIEESKYKDVEAKYTYGEGMENSDEDKAILVESEKNNVKMVSNIYLASKEIITILVYAYVITYITAMFETCVISTDKTKRKMTKKVKVK